MKIAAILAAATACVFASVLAHPLGQPAGAREVTPISVRVTVERPDGTPVTGLTRDDFDVSIDGQTQSIATVSAADGPVSVVLIVDLSVSMNMSDVASGAVLQRTIEQWFPLSLKPGDRGRIGSFARRVFLSEQFTSDRRQLVAAGFAARSVSAADRLGPSPIWDAVDGAVSALEWESGSRAIVLLTDGRATGNRVSLREAGTHAMASAVEIHIIAERDVPISIPQLDGNQTHVMPGIGLRWLAETTGGSYTTDKRFPWSDPGPLVSDAMKRVHQAYTLAFVPESPDGGAHAVDVKVKTPGLTVRSRKQLLAAK